MSKLFCSSSTKIQNWVATPTVIHRLPEVLRVRGRSRSAHYADIQQGLFTPPVSIGARAVGWPAHEVEALNGARIAGKSDDELRQLVAELIAARQSEI